MASQTSTRLWKAHKAANRPWPVLDSDEVIDYQIMEAIAIKADREEKEALKRKEVDEWSETALSNLEAYR